MSKKPSADGLSAEPPHMRHIARAREHMREHDYPAAIKGFRAAVRLAPDGATIHGALGLALRANRGLDEAISELQEAIRLDPEDVVDVALLAEVVAQTGREDEGLAMMRELAKGHPDDAFERYSLGAMLSMRGDYAGALKELRQAIRRDPLLPGVYLQLGRALQKAGNPQPAINALETAAEQDDGLGSHWQLALALAAEGDHDHALEHFGIAVDLSPDLAAVRLGRAMSLLYSGHAEDAVYEMEELADLEPDDPLVQDVRASTCYVAGEYAEAWEAVRACEALGGTPTPELVERLRAEMPEPERSPQPDPS